MESKNQATNSAHLEFSYPAVYLYRYLKEHHFEEANDFEFINARGDIAAQVYEDAFMAGYSIDGADELALKVLMEGFEFSKYDVIEDILSEHYSHAVKTKLEDAAVYFMKELQSVFDKYDTKNPEFSDTAEYDDLVAELKEHIDNFFAEYGIQQKEN